MARINLQTLPTFVEVARHQNLRVAAEALHLTHSAVSQQIGALEERLGFELFERRGRRIVLNPAGEALLREAAPALDRIHQGVQAASLAAGSEHQTLRVTMLPSFAQRWFLPRMASWRRLHPDIPIEIDATTEVVDLQRDGYHAGLRTGDGPWPGLVSERLYEGATPYVAVASPAIAKRLKDRPPEAVAREPLLGDRDLWRRWFRAAGVEANPVPVATFGDLSLMLTATEQDIGVSVVREMFAADALRQGRLVKISEVSFVHEGASSHNLVYPAALRQWPPLVALRTWLHDELEAALKSMGPQAHDAGQSPRRRRKS
jgi:LysR family glycine cleavage system transcriptional activator